MTFASLALAALGVTHHGAYSDPNHYVAGTYAGMRFIAEGPSTPAHVLTMVGSDDGVEWWTVNGTCYTDAMDHLTFDFSAKGGPADLKGIAIDYANNGTSVIQWEDGNVWTWMETPSASVAARSQQPNAELESRLHRKHGSLSADLSP